jgi:hypothetical protein
MVLNVVAKTLEEDREEDNLITEEEDRQRHGTLQK